MKPEKKILGSGLFLLLIAFGSQALTLGRASSSALIGRSLELAIAVQVDAGETAAALCFDAEVFHGDVRQDPGRVNVLVEPTAQPNMLNVRVLSATAVDEPVVTVYLRTGCGQKTTRRYVLLADYPSELAESPAPSKLNPTRAPVAGAALAAPAAAADKGNIAPRKPRSSEPQSTSDQPAPAKPAALPSKGAAVVSGRPVERRAGQPRLQLDPLELFSDRIANLDGAMTFDAPPDALENIQKIKTLEDSLKSLRLLASKNEASLNDLQIRLQKAESNGFFSQTSYMLIALVLACLAALTAVAALWWRQRQAPVTGRWWGNADAGAEADADAVQPAPVTKKTVDTVPAKLATDPVLSQWPISAHSRPRSVSRFGSSELPRSGFGVNVNMTEMSDSAFKEFMPPGTQPGRSSKVADTVPAVAHAARPARNLNSETTLDIRQQAEFFVSLGQTERAAQLLRREIKESEEANPLVYLDLLALFHSLGLKSEYQQLRESFELLFCCRIPAFTFFKNRSLDLESYPEVLAHIVGIWSQPGVMTWLESCIFQTPGRNGSLGFDLAAFQDLLFLHAVAWIRSETPDSPDRGNPGAGVAFASARAQPATPQQELPPFDALDLDLSSPVDAVENAVKPASSPDEPLPFLMPSDFQFDGKIKRT